MNTLMTHQQINCIYQPVSIRCPSGTNVIIKVAQYVSSTHVRETNICGTTDVVKNAAQEHQFKDCHWHDSLQVSTSIFRTVAHLYVYKMADVF